MTRSERTEAAGVAGRVWLRGEEKLLRVLRPLADVACRRRSRERGVFLLEGVRGVRYKLGPLAGKSSLRHAARALLPGLDVPALQEYDNLAWLRRNGFHAPRPLAAGCYRNAFGLPVFQFLYTERVKEARTLREVFEEDLRDLRRPALVELALETARLHERGFVHRDLFPRNLLVTGDASAPCIWFLDAWRGGPYPGLRGPTYDLACLMLFGADLFEPAEQQAFLDAYFAERERLGRPLRRDRLLRSVARQRHRLHRRFVRRRRPESVLPVPSGVWEIPEGKP